MTYLFEGLQYTGFAFTQHRAGFDPAGVHIGKVEGVEKLASGNGSRVRDQIHFYKARALDIPVIGLIN